MSTPIRQPRKRPAPSARDQEIYLAWQVHGQTQDQLAEKHKLTQCRISQIVRKVAAWRSKADPREEGELTTRQQKRLDRWLEHERLGAIARQAIQSFHQEQRTLTTTTVHTSSSSPKSGHLQQRVIENPKSASTTTTRQLPANVQWLKTALRAIELLGKFEDKPYIPAEEPDERQRRAIMHSELRSLRDEAEAEGKVSPSEDPWGVIKRWLDALQGEPNDFKRSDPAMRQLAAHILPPSDRPPTRRASEGSENSHPPEDADAWSGDSPAWDAVASPAPDSHPLTTDNCPLPPFHSPPLSSTYAPSSESSQPPAAERLTPQVAPQKSPPLNPEPRAPSGSLNPFERRLAHERKLERFREANRRGLPIQLEFDPADGPLPVLSGHLDDYGYQPTPQSKEDEAQMVQDYLAKLRAECRANA